eukprot:228565-Chlamydomonas_euryale.AAC.1
MLLCLVPLLALPCAGRAAPQRGPYAGAAVVVGAVLCAHARGERLRALGAAAARRVPARRALQVCAAAACGREGGGRTRMLPSPDGVPPPLPWPCSG